MGAYEERQFRRLTMLARSTRLGKSFIPWALEWTWMGMWGGGGHWPVGRVSPYEDRAGPVGSRDVEWESKTTSG